MTSSNVPSCKLRTGRRMKVVLYRPSLDARSGAGQLLEMQWRALDAAGVPTLIACERGALKFWLRTGVRARRRSVAALERMRAHGAIVGDHGLCLPSAELVFVHNLATEARRHLPRESAADAERREREFFRALNPAAIVVANSKLVADALHEHFDLARERVTVLYPGYRRRRFSPQRAAQLRGAARVALGIDAHAPLVGFVTSGDFAKRGLDLFLDSAARIAAARPDARFLVVGSKELPADARAHALVRDGVVRYRPKSGAPRTLVRRARPVPVSRAVRGVRHGAGRGASDGRARAHVAARRRQRVFARRLCAVAARRPRSCAAWRRVR